MLNIVLKITLIALLAILFVQDLRRRVVSLYILIATFIAVLALVFFSSSFNLTYFGVNVLFIALQVIFLIAYLFITGRKPALLLKKYLGIGDILFWLIPAFYFQTLEFVMYSLACYIAIVLGYGILFVFRRRSTTIPLAGFMALFMAIYMVVGWQNSSLLSNLVSSLITI